MIRLVCTVYMFNQSFSVKVWLITVGAFECGTVWTTNTQDDMLNAVLTAKTVALQPSDPKLQMDLAFLGCQLSGTYVNQL